MKRTNYMQSRRQKKVDFRLEVEHPQHTIPRTLYIMQVIEHCKAPEFSVRYSGSIAV